MTGETGYVRSRMNLYSVRAASVVGLMAMTAAAPATAQDSWRFSGSLYAFMPETTSSVETRFGTAEGTLSFRDALENLDVAFMGAFEAGYGKWSFIADYLLFDLSFENGASNPFFSGVDTDLRAQVFSGYAAYRVHETPTLSIDLGGGFRWFSVDSDVTLRGGPADGLSTGVSNDWIDPLIMARARAQFSERWFGTAAVDYGGFQDDNETWQILLTAGYAINDNWSVRGGYRHLDVSREIDGKDFSFDQSGPILGFTYTF